MLDNTRFIAELRLEELVVAAKHLYKVMYGAVDQALAGEAHQVLTNPDQAAPARHDGGELAKGSVVYSFDHALGTVRVTAASDSLPGLTFSTTGPNVVADWFGETTLFPITQLAEHPSTCLLVADAYRMSVEAEGESA